MRHFQIGRRSMSVVATLVFATLIAAPQVAVGGNAAITFGDWNGLRLADSCVMGQGPANSPLHLVWKDRGGLIKENVWLATADWGGFQHCSSDGDTLIVGDILRATVGSYTRKFVMPSVGVQVDRVNDVIMGTAPANSTILLGYMYTRCCPDYMQQLRRRLVIHGWRFLRQLHG
jgi:hypothetical protein